MSLIKLLILILISSLFMKALRFYLAFKKAQKAFKGKRTKKDDPNTFEGKFRRL